MTTLAQGPVLLGKVIGALAFRATTIPRVLYVDSGSHTVHIAFWIFIFPVPALLFEDSPLEFCLYILRTVPLTQPLGGKWNERGIYPF